MNTSEPSKTRLIEHRSPGKDRWRWGGAAKKNRNGALVKHSPFLFKLASKALDRVRQLLVVGVAPLVNELSLFLRCLLFASLFLGCLLLSCHIVLLLSCGYDHKILCSRNSCGLEKTAHNILLYKLNSHCCQQFITCSVNYFRTHTRVERLLQRRRVIRVRVKTITLIVDDEREFRQRVRCKIRSKTEMRKRLSGRAE